MSKKNPTAWDRVPKEKRKKVIADGIKGALVGYLGLVPNVEEESNEQTNKDEDK